MRKLTVKLRLLAAGTASMTTLLGFAATAPMAHADVFTSYVFSAAATNSNPVAPRFFENFANTVNMGGSETAEYAMEPVGALYTNAGVFGCVQNSDKRTCNLTNAPTYTTGGGKPTTQGGTAAVCTPPASNCELFPGSAINPSTDYYDNYDHNVIVSSGLAVGSAAGVGDLCSQTNLPDQPATLAYSTSTGYYDYPMPGTGTGANGIPLDLVRASASLFQLNEQGITTSCAAQAGLAQDAVVGLTFTPENNAGNPGLPDGVSVEDPAWYVTNGVTYPSGYTGPYNFDLSNAGGTGALTDTAYRVFCESASNPDSITTWDQLYSAEGVPTDDWPPTDQPIVLWGTKANSGTGADFYDFAGCTEQTFGRIPSSHLITENQTEQLSLYAAQLASSSITLNGAFPAGATTNTLGTSANIDCGDGLGDTGFGTAKYDATGTYNFGTTSPQQCVAQEVADSIFFMSYGYYVSHPYTASLTIPTAADGSSPDYIECESLQPASATGCPFTDLTATGGEEYQVEGTATTINGQDVSGPNLGSPVAVTGDPRGQNAGAVATGRNLYLDYIPGHVRASAAGFVNWVCDAGNTLEPKGADETTGVPYDTEITQDVTAWGWNRISCDLGTGTSYSPAISFTTGSGASDTNGAIIDAGPPNNE